jgi:hypothetical protein
MLNTFDIGDVFKTQVDLYAEDAKKLANIITTRAADLQSYRCSVCLIVVKIRDPFWYYAVPITTESLTSAENRCHGRYTGQIEASHIEISRFTEYVLNPQRLVCFHYRFEVAQDILTERCGSVAKSSVKSLANCWEDAKIMQLFTLLNRCIPKLSQGDILMMFTATLINYREQYSRMIHSDTLLSSGVLDRITDLKWHFDISKDIKERDPKDSTGDHLSFAYKEIYKAIKGDTTLQRAICLRKDYLYIDYVRVAASTINPCIMSLW